MCNVLIRCDVYHRRGRNLMHISRIRLYTPNAYDISTQRIYCSAQVFNAIINKSRYKK